MEKIDSGTNHEPAVMYLKRFEEQNASSVKRETRGSESASELIMKSSPKYFFEETYEIKMPSVETKGILSRYMNITKSLNAIKNPSPGKNKPVKITFVEKEIGLQSYSTESCSSSSSTCSCCRIPPNSPNKSNSEISAPSIDMKIQTESFEEELIKNLKFKELNETEKVLKLAYENQNKRRELIVQYLKLKAN